MKKKIVLAVLALALALAGSASAGAGAGVSTDLVRVDMTQPSATIQFESTDEQPEKFEASVLKWTPAGLQPTEEVSASPRFFEVAARSKQQIDLFAAEPRGEVEGTYRLVFKALDGTATLSVPVFLPPASPGRPQVVATRNGNTLTVKNTGNVTQRIAKVYEQNGLLADVQLYLLPGQKLSVDANQMFVLGNLSQNKE